MGDRHRHPGLLIRADSELRDRFTQACAQTGSDRSTVLREFMRWYAGDAVQMPKRPGT